MVPQLPKSQEAANFVRACEAIYGVLAHGGLSADDGNLIRISGLVLLNKLALA